MAIWFVGNAFDAKPCPNGCRLPATLVTDTGTNDFWMFCRMCERETKTGSAYSAVQFWNGDVVDDNKD